MVVDKWFIVLIVLPQVIRCDPCSQTVYQIVDERRRSSSYVVKDPSYEDLICDRVTQGWVRFEHGEMPTTCIQPYRCGTHVPLWLNGTLPPKDNREHAMTACGNSAGRCCRIHLPVTVKNCGTYYVYNLTPTQGCSIAYCAGNKVPCPPDQWSPSGFQPGCTASYPKMTQSPKLSNPIVLPNTFKFNCDINFDPSRRDVGFQVEWLFDGKPDRNVPKTQVGPGQRVASMDQKYLQGHLGETLSCRVRTYFVSSPGRMSPGIESNGYWCGIKISEASITVGENEKPRTMKLISTIPIVCDKPNQASCNLEVYLDPNNHNTAQTTGCTQVLRPKDWNPTTHTAETTFQVLAERDGKKNGDKNLELHFQKVFTFDAPTLFNNYSIPYLQIRTKDKDTSSCRCWGDPHCSTFDSQLTQHNKADVLNYYKIGEFQLFKSTASQFEVQVRTWSCGRVSCICAVAAREGNDVFVVDICHGSYGHTFPHATILNKAQMSQGTVIQENSKGDGWIVYFPTGNTVTINTNNRYLTVEVKATETDWGHTQGICGTFDGNLKNDFTHKDGTLTGFPNRVPDNFVESWRIPVGTSIFDKGFKPDTKYNHDQYFCNCDQQKKLIDCRINGQSPPAIRNNYHVIAQGQQGTNTGRRQLTADDLDYALPQYRFYYGLFWTPVLPNFPTPSGRTQQDAEKLCNDAFNRDPAIQACRRIAGIQFQNTIDECVEDIKFTDETAFIQGAIDAAIMTCSEVVLKDPAYYNNVTGQPPAFITTDLCLSQCSGHGLCSHGTCRCHAGYTGVACEINTRKPPVIDGIISSRNGPDICNLARRPCEVIYVFGNNFMNSTTTKCKLEELRFDGTNYVESGRIHQTTTIYKNRFNLGCPLPKKTGHGGQSVSGYRISLTNDGHQYGNTTNVFVIDIRCMKCSSTGGNCTIKDQTCLVDGICRPGGSSNPSNHNEVCDPSTSKTAWTVHQPTNKSSPTVHHVTHTTASHRQTTPPVQHHTSGTAPVAPLGGVRQARFDIWTSNQTGCPCLSDPRNHTCACCDPGAVQCPSPNMQQCVQTGKLNNCGTPLPSPDYGIDGYTVALSDCDCTFNDQYDCACCQNGGCPCGHAHKNQCVDCKHMNQCGNKPWLFGTPYTN